MSLTILIPAIPERLHKVRRLYKKLDKQIGDSKDIFVPSLCDNMMMTIGEKRNTAKNLVKSDYFTFVDDDDDISHDYIKEIRDAMTYDPDIITFKQKSTLDGRSFIVTFGLDVEESEPARMIKGRYVDIMRRPFHVCVWKTSLVQRFKFPFIQYGEDWAWCKKALKRIETSVHIDKVLHYYNWDSKKTRAK